MTHKAPTSLRLKLEPSSLLDDSTEEQKALFNAHWRAYAQSNQQAGLDLDRAAIDDIPTLRTQLAASFYTTPIYRQLQNRYDFSYQQQQIAGVPVEWFTPTAGVSPGHQGKLLINLHGGGFWEGSGVASHLESVPIACRTNIPVLSIDYRRLTGVRLTGVR